MEGIEFAGYASVFNIIDNHRDVIEKSCFSNTLRKFGPNYVDLLFDHDLNKKVGKIIILNEDNYGLYVEGIIDTNLPKSQHLINAIENKKILHFSIGYYPKIIKKKGGINYVSDLDLIEISFVSYPANINAQILNIEGLYTEPSILKMFNQIKSFFIN